ncbi:AMP-binding protein [uncultured Parasphingopyxis sp.]|uniref:AMP-binding protein n=1 Tax=uncultured Parasphingopyxis sp. TaxID=1547918 RepID=UPI0026345B2F|nr:AMP-binding protein [uncultured Parasphingopyxis sp.]
MLGGMQDAPLRVTNIIDHAAREHGHREVVSRWADGTTSRSNWAGIHEDARKCAQALQKLGVEKGDRVGTLAMNHGHHLASWYGIAGVGGVLHTINPRLFEEQLVYIMNHAEDRVLLFDKAFEPLVEKIKPQLKTIQHFVLFDGEGDYPTFRELCDAEDGDFKWVEGDERDPCGLCYTSGTTGNPKGVLYEHRSNVLHAITEGQPDAMNLSTRSVMLPIVPMFHANAWGLPYACAVTGSKMVFSAVNDGEVLCNLVLNEGVTHSAGVPTVWLAMFAHMDATKVDYGKLEMVVIGGSAAPRAMIERFMKAGVYVLHAWGMTETSPIGTIGQRPWNWDELGFDEQVDIISKQGRTPFGVEIKIVDDDGNDLPRDGESSGRLLVRGPWVLDQYYQDDGGKCVAADQWFDTGDLVEIIDGRALFQGRLNGSINIGGNKVMPEEVEQIIGSHPSVAAVLVRAKKSSVAGALVEALVQLHPEVPESQHLEISRQIKVLCRDQLAVFKAPAFVKMVDKLPVSDNGKVMRNAT